MNKLPINEGSHQPNPPHTVMEKPLWLGRTESFPITLFVTWFVMFATCLLPTLIYSSQILCHLWISTLPLFLAIYIDDHFSQKFFMRDWERSKQFDDMTIRDIPLALIRDWVEWHILNRRKMIFALAFFNLFFTLLFGWLKAETAMLLVLDIPIVSLIGGLVRAHFALKKFGFSGADLGAVSTFNSANSNPLYHPNNINPQRGRSRWMR